MFGTLVKKLLKRDDDPYWDTFINRPLADPKNLVLDVITGSPGGGVFTPKIDVHDTKAMAGHIVQLTKFFGADSVGVIATDPRWVREDEEKLPAPGEIAAVYPYTIVSLAHWEYDAANNKGMGGQLGRQKVAAAHFHLRSYLREIGFDAVFAYPSTPQIFVAAGLATSVSGDRIITRQFGDKVATETLVLTNLPMIPTAGPWR